MADAGMSFALGFIGNEPVHRDNARALLADLIAAYKRDNKTAKIRFILPTEPFTETMSDLADYCATSGYQIGFVGPDFSGPEIAPYRADAEGNLYSLSAGSSLAKGMISALSVWDDTRLILVADPATDDAAYTALVTAVGMGIKVRSLLHGLDEVLMENPDEEEQPDMHVVEDEENEEFDEESEDEELEEEPIDEDGEEEDEIDYVALGTAADGGDEDAQVELVDLAKAEGIDPDAYGTWAEVADLLAPVDESQEYDDEEESGEEESGGAEDEDGFFDTTLEEGDEEEADEEDLTEEVVDEEDDDTEEEEGDDAEEVGDDSDEVDDEESDAEEERTTVPANKKLTEESLIKLGERDKDAFYETCAEYDVYPGRGQKVPIMARKVMEAIEGGLVKSARVKKPAAKKTTKKAAPAKRTATAKKAPAKKSTAAKKAPAAKKATTTRVPARTAASSNGHVDKALLRAALKSSKAFTELAESLL
jgi:hypothetical protein